MHLSTFQGPQEWERERCIKNIVQCAQLVFPPPGCILENGVTVTFLPEHPGGPHTPTSKRVAAPAQVRAVPRGAHLPGGPGAGRSLRRGRNPHGAPQPRHHHAAEGLSRRPYQTRPFTENTKTNTELSLRPLEINIPWCSLGKDFGPKAGRPHRSHGLQGAPRPCSPAKGAAGGAPVRPCSSGSAKAAPGRSRGKGPSNAGSGWLPT